MKPNHLIKRQKFILKVADAQQATAIQDRISRLFHGKLVEKINDIFTDFFPEEDVFEIDRLTIDIGKITAANLEKSIESTLLRQLPLILAQIINNKRYKGVSKNENSKLKLLKFYLKNGHLPWWASNRENFNLDELLKYLLENNTQSTKKLLTGLLSSEAIRKRLIYQVKGDTLQNVKRLITDSENTEYNWYLEQLSKLHQHAKIREITKKSYSNFTENILLEYLTQESKLTQSPQKFGLYFLEKTVQRFNISAEEIQDYYEIRTPRKSASQAEIDWLQSIDVWLSERNIDAGTDISDTELIFNFLQTGLIAHSISGKFSLSDMEAKIVKLSLTHNYVWRERLKKLLHLPNVLGRMRYQLSASTLEIIHKMLYGEKHYRLIQYIWTDLRKMKRLSGFAAVEDKDLYPIYLDAVTRYFPNFRELEDFGGNFLDFLSRHLANTGNLNLKERVKKFSKSDEAFVKKSSILQRVFQPYDSFTPFVGDVWVELSHEPKSFNESEFKSTKPPAFNSKNITVPQLLKERNKAKLLSLFSTEKFVGSSEKAEIKEKALRIVRASDFFDSVAPDLNIVEIANLGRIIFEKEADKYVKTVSLMSKFLAEKPLPVKINKMQMSPARLLWLGLLKYASQKNYHGNRGQKFWQNWMTALSELLNVPTPQLWLYFQNIPKEISQSLPDFKNTLVQNMSNFAKSTQTEKPKIIVLTRAKIIENFLATNKLPAKQTVSQLENLLQQAIRNDAKELQKIIFSTLPDFSCVRIFRRFSTATIELIEQYYFQSVQPFLQENFADFQKLISHSDVLPRLSVKNLERDVRLGQVHLLAYLKLNIPTATVLVHSVFKVLTQFYAVTESALILDFAKSVQKKRCLESGALFDYFNGIELPVQQLDPTQSLLYFLKNGMLSPMGEFANLTEMQIWIKSETTKENLQLAKVLLRTLQQPHYLQRVFRQFNQVGISSLSEILAQDAFPNLALKIIEFEKFFQKQDYPAAVKNRSTEIMQTGLLHFLIKEPQPPFDPNRMFKFLIQHISEQYPELMHTGTYPQAITASLSAQKLENESAVSANKFTLQKLETAFFAFVKTQKLSSPFKEEFVSAEQLLSLISQQPSLTFLEKLPVQLRESAPEILSYLMQNFSLDGIKNLNQLLNGTWINQEEIFLSEIKLLLNSSKTFAPVQAERLTEMTVLEILITTVQPTIPAVLDSVFEKVRKITALSSVKLRRELTQIIIRKKDKFVQHPALISWILEDTSASDSVKFSTETELNEVMIFLRTGAFSHTKTIKSVSQAEKVLIESLAIRPRLIFLNFQKIKQYKKTLERLEDNFSLNSLDKIVQSFSKTGKGHLLAVTDFWTEIDWKTLHVFPFEKKLTASKVRVLAIETLLYTPQNEDKDFLLLKKLFSTQAKKVNISSIELMYQVSSKLLLNNDNLGSKDILVKIKNYAQQKSLSKIERALEITLESKPTQQQVILNPVDFLEKYWRKKEGNYYLEKELEAKFIPNLLSLAQENPKVLKKMMRKEWKKGSVQKTFFKQMKSKDLFLISENVYAAHSTFIKDWVYILQKSLAQMHATFPDGDSLRISVWSPVLDYLWQTERFSEAQFILKTTQKSAQQNQISLEKWQTLLTATTIDNQRNLKITANEIKKHYKIADKVQTIVPRLEIDMEHIDYFSQNKSETPRETIQNKLWEELQNIKLYLESGSHKNTFNSQAAFVKVFQTVLKKHPHLIKKIVQHLVEKQEAIFRILASLPERSIYEVIRLLYSSTIDTILRYQRDLLSLLPGILAQFNRSTAEDLFKYQALSYYPKGRYEMAVIPQFLAHLISVTAKKDNKNPLVILHRIKENVQKDKLKVKGNWEKMIPQLYKILQEEAQKGQQKIKWDLENQEDLEGAAFYINNAGLVLIAPFFPRYFNMLGLLENGQFVDTIAAERAVHLLQYIATGQTETEEPFLVFNKILCGVALSTPVPKSIELTEKEEQVTAEMLQAILAHWKGLGTTTLEGLRGGFLIRNGKLEMHSGGYWNLDVEKKAYDILLQSLPWSISIIQPSWMENRIQVTWN